MQQALIRHVWRGHVASALPAIVVDDRPDRVVTWTPRGTQIRWITATPMPVWLDQGFGTVGKEWDDTNVLAITPYGRAHTVWAMWWADNDAFLGWYVNLQDPLRRTPLGWDTFDHELDILVGADLRWEWKDEGAFAERIELGIHTREEGDEIRREGERVIADIEAARPPYCEPWPEWRPDPSWPLPTLPDDWDVL